MLTIPNGLTEVDKVANCFDLSDDPSGSVKTNDLIKVVGNLTLTGTHTILINPLNGTLRAGTYTLITYSGKLKRQRGQSGRERSRRARR